MELVWSDHINSVIQVIHGLNIHKLINELINKKKKTRRHVIL